jgi:hypothetical protein
MSKKFNNWLVIFLNSINRIERKRKQKLILNKRVKQNQSKLYKNKVNNSLNKNNKLYKNNNQYKI